MQPTPERLVDSVLGFLEAVGAAGSGTNALGSSLGGAVLYYLRARKPGAVGRCVLYAPALPCLLADPFLDGLRGGTHRLLDFRSREDVKHVLRTFFWIDPETRPKKTRRKDPIPKMFYEVLYRVHERDVPKGHFKALQDSLLLGAMGERPPEQEGRKTDPDPWGSDGVPNSETATPDPIYATTTDLDPDCHRLVVWGEEDQISDAAKGRRFFGASPRTTLETIPACGHGIDANGTGNYELLAPIVRGFLLDFS